MAMPSGNLWTTSYASKSPLSQAAPCEEGVGQPIHNTVTPERSPLHLCSPAFPQGAPYSMSGLLLGLTTLFPSEITF